MVVESLTQKKLLTVNISVDRANTTLLPAALKCACCVWKSRYAPWPVEREYVPAMQAVQVETPAKKLQGNTFVKFFRKASSPSL